MSKFAILDENNIVINIIVADTEQIARQVTNDAIIVPIDEDDLNAQIGGTYSEKNGFDLPDHAKPLTPEQLVAQAKEWAKNNKLNVS